MRCEISKFDVYMPDFPTLTYSYYYDFTDFLFSAGLLAGINVAVTTTDNAVHVINTATMREDWTARSLCITSRRESVPRRKALKNEAGG